MINETHLTERKGKHLAVDVYRTFDGCMNHLKELPPEARGFFKRSCLGSSSYGDVLNEDISPEDAISLVEEVCEEYRTYPPAAPNKSMRTVREEQKEGKEIYEIGFFFGFGICAEEYIAEFEFPLGTFERTEG